MKVKEKIDVRTLIDDYYTVIQKGMPYDYINTVQLQFPAISTQMVKNIKNRTNQYPTKNIKVLKYLHDLAVEFQSSINL